MRIGLTIAFNAKHHFEHNDYAKRLLDMLDLWVVVEGATQNNGSTAWCRKMDDKWHKDGHSTDGTLEYLYDLNRNNLKMRLATKDGGPWSSKDNMVNAGLMALDIWDTEDNYLWQIDADEQWTAKDMDAAERMLEEHPDYDTASFHCRHYVGKNLIAIGEWGGGVPWVRLWKWNGEPFLTHEPPRLDRKHNIIQLPQMFDHYSYYFEKDVMFKDQWYRGHEGIHQRWLDLQKETVFPQPISRLFGDNPIGHWNSQIVKL